ncbi:MAG TPA: hypothetical protein VFI98_06485 [Pseudolabrys sp.]|nr:hypothetical protein [Pseudolabrys sp.]
MAVTEADGVLVHNTPLIVDGLLPRGKLFSGPPASRTMRIKKLISRRYRAIEEINVEAVYARRAYSFLDHGCALNCSYSETRKCGSSLEDGRFGSVFPIDRHNKENTWAIALGPDQLNPKCGRRLTRVSSLFKCTSPVRLRTEVVADYAHVPIDLREKGDWKIFVSRRRSAPIAVFASFRYLEIGPRGISDPYFITEASRARNAGRPQQSLNTGMLRNQVMGKFVKFPLAVGAPSMNHKSLEIGNDIFIVLEVCRNRLAIDFDIGPPLVLRSLIARKPDKKKSNYCYREAQCNNLPNRRIAPPGTRIGLFLHSCIHHNLLNLKSRVTIFCNCAMPKRVDFSQ